MSTTTPPTRWTRIQMGDTTTWFRVGMYGMLLVVTGTEGRWTWRMVDQASGITMFAGKNALIGRRYYRTFQEARKVAWGVMRGLDARWTDNLYTTSRKLKHLVKSGYFFPDETEGIVQEIEFMRAQARHRMIVARGGKRAVCDLCGQKPDHLGLQLHELLQRGLTVHNSPARALSYEPELTVLLCADCHARAHNPEMRDKLFRRNFSRFGHSRVKQVFERFKRAYEIPGNVLDIRLPEPGGPERSERQHGIRIVSKEVTG